MGTNGIYGLSGSGLDVESLVKMGMLNKQNQYDKMEQKKIYETWQKEAYNGVYKDIGNYYNSLSTYKMQSNMNAMQASSNNTSAVSATANGAAAAMNHTISVSDVASNAYLQSKEGVTRDGGTIATSTYLRDVIFKKVETGKDAQGNYSYDVTFADGTKKSVNGSDIAISLTIQDEKAGNPANITTYKLEYTYDQLMQDDKTLSDFASAFSKSGANIQGNYDTTNDSFSLYNKTSGSKNIIGIAAANKESAVLMNNLHLAQVDSVNNSIGSEIDFSAAPTTSESKVIENSAISTSLKDVLGLKADLVKNGEDDYTLTFTQADGTKTILENKTLDELKNAQAFSMNLSDSAKNTTVGFTYADLFDMDSVGSLKAKASLNTLAQKINDEAAGAGMSIVAAYDEKNDSFSLNNTNGGAILTADSSDAVGTKMVSALNLNTGTIAREKTISTGNSLKDVLGFSAAYAKNDDGSFTVTIQNSAGKESAFKGTLAELKDKNLFNLKITDTDDISIKLGDLVDLSGMTSAGGSLDAKMSLDDLADKITAIGDKVSASYDSDARKLTIKNTAGEAGLALDSADITGLGAQLAAKLSVAETKESADAKKSGVPTQSEGTNAKAVIDGKEYDLDTNRVTVAGVTYTITGKTDRAVVSVTQDTDKIVDFVKNFVDAYNTLIDSLNDKLSEKKYSDYKPLSSRQEEEMTEKQIEKWTEKAKSGLLYNDSTIRNLVSAMRDALYTRVDAVDSEYNTMSSIGITTTTTKGHITFSEDKLRKALAEDPDCAYQLFASDQDSSYIAGVTSKKPLTESQKRSDYANTGVASRLYNVMSEYKTKISDIAGVSTETNDQSYLGKMITQMQNKMSTFKTMMNAYERQLFKRYDAMEVALSKLGMQLNYITGYNS